MTDHDKPKRRRPWQFGLRALLLLMFGAACFLGGWTAHEVKRQRELERAKTSVPMFLDTYEAVEEVGIDWVDAGATEGDGNSPEGSP